MPLDLIGALVDGEHTGIAVEAFHGVFLDVAVAAVDLDGLGGDAVDHLRGKALGHGGGHGAVLAALLHVGGVEHQQPGSFHIHGHVGDDPLQALELGDGLTELLALLGVFDRLIQGRLGHAQGERCNTDAPGIQAGHGDGKAFSFLAQQPLGGHLAVVEHQINGVRGALPHLVLHLVHAKTRQIGGDKKGADAIAAALLGARQHNHHAAVLAGGDKSLGAVEDIHVPFLDGAATQGLGIGTGLGLGEGKGADELSGCHGHQEFLFLFFAAKAFDAAAADRVMHRHDHRR